MTDDPPDVRDSQGRQPLEGEIVEPADAGPVPVGPGYAVDADTSWIENAGFEVTRDAPPVGSVAAGLVGVGFDLLVPSADTGRLELAESYDAQGRRLDRSAIDGRPAPSGAVEAAPGATGTRELAEGLRDQRKGPEEASGE